jgi:hypothetical protein
MKDQTTPETGTMTCKIVNPDAQYVHEAFGIPGERIKELKQDVITWVRSRGSEFSESDIIHYASTICKTNEELAVLTFSVTKGLLSD